MRRRERVRVLARAEHEDLRSGGRKQQSRRGPYFVPVTQIKRDKNARKPRIPPP
jgi:hypothetical protein